ncbi:S1C family serine protease [Paenibacillus sp. GCM10027627]|uniref:S1C family serine protease n=1 Tax=unclassified Paenibacillus TaxID=185978 RepID=UPI0036394114
MDDQNNKKGYDDFFRNTDGKENESNHRDNGDNQPAAPSSNDGQAKPSYYYSYGPMSGDNAPDPASSAKPYEQNNSPFESKPIEPKSYEQRPYEQRPYEHNGYPNDSQAVQAPVPQARPFTTSSNANQNGWPGKEKRGTSFKSIVASFLAGVLVVGGLMYTADVRNWFTPGDSVAATQSGSGSGTSASSGSSGSTASAVMDRPDNIAQLFETASPAVVKIETFVNPQTNSGGGGLLDDPFFRQFFGDNYPEAIQPNQGGQGGEMQQSGIGTGFFFDSTGYILTNQHVVGNSDEIRVTVQGYDKPFTAKLLGNSYELDLAVLKIEGEKAFPTLPLGSADEVNIGDWVVAIGNPYGFDHTITVGVLSAKERPIDIQDQQGERNYKHLLQTDASINPGNSGGPLLNVKGEVIGINTAVSSQAQGIGFAIPTSTINEVLDSLKNNKEVPKEPAPFIGAELYQMTEEFAKQLGVEKAEGSLVKSVYYNSPAYLAGLKQFDVITGIGGKAVTTTDALIKAIQEKKVGDKVEFNVIRQKEAINVVVEIGDKNVFGLQE